MGDTEGELPVVSLVEEDGRRRDFRLHDAFQVEGSDYYLVEADDETGLVLILKEGPGGLESISGDEFDRVMAVLEAEDRGEQAE